MNNGLGFAFFYWHRSKYKHFSETDIHYFCGAYTSWCRREWRSGDR